MHFPDNLDQNQDYVGKSKSDFLLMVVLSSMPFRPIKVYPCRLVGDRPRALYRTYKEAEGNLLDEAQAHPKPDTHNVVPPAKALRRIFHCLGT